MITNIGELNKLIFLGQFQEVLDDDGFIVGKEFLAISKAWAKVKDLSSKEFYEAKALQLEETTQFTIRYKRGIDYKHFIKFNNDVYEIIHINNLDHANRFLEIKAKILRDK